MVLFNTAFGGYGCYNITTNDALTLSYKMIKFEVMLGVCYKFSRPNHFHQNSQNDFLILLEKNNINIELCLTNAPFKKKRRVYVRRLRD